MRGLSWQIAIGMAAIGLQRESGVCGGIQVPQG